MTMGDKKPKKKGKGVKKDKIEKMFPDSKFPSKGKSSKKGC